MGYLSYMHGCKLVFSVNEVKGAHDGSIHFFPTLL